VDLRPLIPLAWFLAGGIALAFTLIWLQRRGSIKPRPQRKRGGGGHALLGLQEFIEPSVEFIVQAKNAEQKKENEGDALEDDREALLADLAQSLRYDPVDHEEVRRHLAALQRSGYDWQAHFEQALRDELAARPYRAPVLPPVWRVAPVTSVAHEACEDGPNPELP
jgi:hypothetical protein